MPAAALPLPRGSAGAGGKASLPLPPAAAGKSSARVLTVLQDETQRQQECVDAYAKLCAGSLARLLDRYARTHVLCSRRSRARRAP